MLNSYKCGNANVKTTQVIDLYCVRIHSLGCNFILQIGRVVVLNNPIPFNLDIKRGDK